MYNARSPLCRHIVVRAEVLRQSAAKRAQSDGGAVIRYRPAE